ncbi:hypothetical protein [Streptomyces sp. NBC_01217]|uniref:hypothetical protein n=1 Tax=Streptomyces sp. NBC_01217 TaxID=2903779 RepID=UPI002E0E7CF6|nr:hypothetical protein OG507_00195 [Streptomyces sp. NBC_01217]WSQ62566.1 hypothetical protein OG507_39375 [Streptomyces sp. NBC_01217]
MPFQEAVCLSQSAGATVEFPADLGRQRGQEPADLRRGVGELADHAASGVLEDLDERDAVRVDAVAVSELHDDAGQAVVHDQVRPHFLAYQLRVGGSQNFLPAPLEGLDLPIGRFHLSGRCGALLRRTPLRTGRAALTVSGSSRP